MWLEIQVVFDITSQIALLSNVNECNQTHKSVQGMGLNRAQGPGLQCQHPLICAVPAPTIEQCTGALIQETGPHLTPRGFGAAAGTVEQHIQAIMSHGFSVTGASHGHLAAGSGDHGHLAACSSRQSW